MRKLPPLTARAPQPENYLTTPNRELSLLHPVVRAAVVETIRTLRERDVEFGVFEGWRSPDRQSYLYAQGRTRPGNIVTKYPAWESVHQYGLAADLAICRDGRWSWSTEGAASGLWDDLHEVGEAFGLETPDGERQHLQLAGVDLSQLKAGMYPAGGDRTWWDNLEKARREWEEGKGG